DYIFVFGGYDNGYLNDLYVGEILWQTGVDDDQVEPCPSRYALHQNHPNPFNPVTTIQYELPRDCHVKLDVCNIAGQRVTTLVDSPREAGIWSATWDAMGTASGVYFCRLSADGVTVTRKMVLLE
ncbi:T9SS type A sorting domain-containing protein, partial [bacterium]|nr:T9SS type A sorting domain-containing protein [bacterium]